MSTIDARFVRVWSAGKIGAVTLRNRFVLTGHGTLMVKEGRATDQLLAYYAARAAGGVGLQMIGTQQVHPSSPGLGHLLANYDDDFIPELKKIAGAIHVAGGKAFGYIGHFGAFAGAYPSPAWAPSSLFVKGNYSRAMTERDIADITSAHAKAAVRNVAAGFDGVEVHCGHGLLLHQFLSPLTNKRTDSYGGSLEAQMRFPLQVLRAVRKAIGPDVPMGPRISGSELIKGGLTQEDMILVVKAMIDHAAIDFVDVSMGNDTDETSAMLHHPPMGLAPLPFADTARAIRRAAGIPIIHGTRVASAEQAETLLASESADFAGMCRALIADPELPNKAREGRLAEIIPCIGCVQACLGHLERSMHISCVGNPVTGRELAWGQISPATQCRRVLVVGGGPAGMEAAIVAARRGHQVDLYERSASLGGALSIAAKATSREAWNELIKTKISALRHAQVRIHTDTALDVDMIRALQCDVVVVATGSVSGSPQFIGNRLPNVLFEREVLNNPDLVTGNVVVADTLDYTSGLSVSLDLLKLGHGVTLVTAGPMAGGRLEKTTRNYLFTRFLIEGGKVVTDSVITSFDGAAAVLTHTLTGQQTALAGIDTLVLAPPPNPLRTLSEALERSGITFIEIGDCQAPRSAEFAILEGHQAGRAI